MPTRRSPRPNSPRPGSSASALAAAARGSRSTRSWRRGGMILSDLGAEVIKIEKIGGEETRKSEPIVRGQSIYFSVYNRGKKSLCLDMRTERGKEIFAALVPTADMVLQNFRPGVMEKMGFGYDRLCELKPDIILISVSGFGQYGPRSE